VHARTHTSGNGGKPLLFILFGLFVSASGVTSPFAGIQSTRARVSAGTVGARYRPTSVVRTAEHSIGVSSFNDRGKIVIKIVSIMINPITEYLY